jgi:hypothetical protein
MEILNKILNCIPLVPLVWSTVVDNVLSIIYRVEARISTI